MFDFLRKKKKETLTLTKEEKIENIKTFLLLNSVLYLEQESKNSPSVPNLIPLNTQIKTTEDNLSRLKKLGFKNSQNYAEVEKVLEDLRRKRLMTLTQVRFLKRVKAIGELFPDTSFLVSYDVFYTLLKKYGLMIGRVNDYTGVIPEKNLKEIETVQEKLKEISAFYLPTPYKDLYEDLGLGKYYRVMLLVKDVSSLSYTDDGEVIKRLVEKEWRNLIPSPVDYRLLRGNGIERYSINSYLKCIYTEGIFEKSVKYFKEDPIWTSINGFPVTSDTLLIAAPEKYLKNKVTVSSFPVDPIVFQPCPYGVLIHSVWGEEAEDKVLADYLRINNIIKGNQDGK